MKGEDYNIVYNLSKFILYAYIVILWITGLACLGVSIWMYADPNVLSYLTIMQRTVGDDALLASVGLLLVAGVLIIGVGLLGFFGLLKENKTFLSLFSLCLMLIMIIELTVGFLCAVFIIDIHRSLQVGMHDQIKEEYEHDNSIGKAWNNVQVRNKCCGSFNSTDYRFSNWWHDENSETGDGEWLQASVHVPDTCCVLIYEQERDVRRVEPQDAKPQNRDRCNEDAAGNKYGSPNLRARGCFAAMFDWNEQHLYVLMGLGLAFGILQIFGLILSIFVTTVIGRREL